MTKRQVCSLFKNLAREHTFAVLLLDAQMLVASTPLISAANCQIPAKVGIADCQQMRMGDMGCPLTCTAKDRPEVLHHRCPQPNPVCKSQCGRTEKFGTATQGRFVQASAFLVYVVRREFRVQIRIRIRIKGASRTPYNFVELVRPIEAFACWPTSSHPSAFRRPTSH